MSDYYIRIRGRQQGPYDMTQLKGLAKKGVLGRMHEVSEDGHEFVSASEFPDIFRIDESEAVRPISDATSASAAQQPSDGVVSGQGGQWHYAKGSQKLGPVSESQIIQMVSNGQLEAHDRVWTKGMENWMEASGVATLSGFFAATDANSKVSPARNDSVHIDTSNTSKSGNYFFHTLRRLRPWVLFVAIVGDVVAGLLLVSSVVVLAMGPSSVSVSSGLTMGVQAVVIFLGALLLHFKSSKINEVARSESTDRFTSLFESMIRFWIYVSIVLIVFIAFVVVSMIVALSSGSSISSIYR